MKKLTRRQQEFLSRFLDVYIEGGEALHYSTVAERLGIGKVTAYEMLRLLEERGLVEAYFHLPEGGHGPGRSTVLFRPTPEATRLLQELAGKTIEDSDWESSKELILEQLRAGKAGEYEALLSTLLSRVSEQRSPLIFTMEMITTIILAVALIKDTAEASGLNERLQRIGLPGEIGLSALAGIGSALSLVERTNRRVANFLLAESGRYQAILVQLSEENRHRLSEFAREIVKIINA